MITDDNSSEDHKFWQSGYQQQPMHQMALQRRLDALFRALASDFLLREQFITDPIQIASEYIYRKPIAPRTAAALNYLIYSCLANDYLISWFRDYSFRNGCSEITQEKFLRDFSLAVVENNANNVVSALANIALAGTVHLSLSNTWLQVIFGHWYNFDKDEIEPGAAAPMADEPGPVSPKADEPSTADIAEVDLSDDKTLTDVTWKTYMTGKMPPFVENTQSFFSTSHIIVTLEALTSYARELIRADALESVWAE